MGRTPHLGNLVPAIAEGKRNVAAGEAQGHVARTGVTYGTHVFFCVRENRQAVYPLGMLPLLRSFSARLKAFGTVACRDARREGTAR